MTSFLASGDFDCWRGGRPVVRIQSGSGGFDYWRGGLPTLDTDAPGPQPSRALVGLLMPA